MVNTNYWKEVIFLYGDKIKELREIKGLGVNELSRLSGVSAGYISALERGEKQNPSPKTLEKLAIALDTTVSRLISVRSSETLSNDNELPTSFKTPEEAIKFILEQPTIMGYGGFDVNKLSNADLMNFANDLLKQLKLLSYKYKR